MRFSHVQEADGGSVSVGECGRCGGEICRGERYYWVDGEALCEDCLEDFAREFFAPFQVRGGEDSWDE